MELRPVVTEGRYYESPRWHAGRLWFVDSLARTVLRVGKAGKPEIVATIDGIPSGLGFLPGGEPIVVSMFDRRLLRVDRDQVVLHADLSNSSAGTLDDMIVDTTGRIYVGDLGIDLCRPPGDFSAPAGRILLISNESGATVVAEGLRFPNGIAVSGDGKQLVVAESNGDCLTRYEILGDGSLSLRGRAGGFGEPDGICMDAEGAAWTALYKEDSFIRVDPHGRVTHRIPAPGGRGIACVLGGDSRRTLFCISAETTHQNLMKGRSAARIDASEVEVPGAGFREHFDFPRSRKASPHTPPCPPKPGF